MKSKSDDEKDAFQQEIIQALGDIKGLLILLLMKTGATQGELAKALSTTQGTISKNYRLGNEKPLVAEMLNVGDHKEG